MIVRAFPEIHAGDAGEFVATIRLYDPLAAVARTHPLRWSIARLGDALDADAVVVQRAPFASAAQVDQAANALDTCRRRGTRVLWELDDAIFCDELPGLIATSAVDEIDHEAVARVQAHRRLLDAVDGFVCPTEALAGELRRLAPELPVSVIPVALAFDHPRWSIDAAPRGRRTIGWCGGSRVGRDLELLPPVLERAFARFPDLHFLLAGSTKYASLFRSLPPGRVAVAEWVPYDEYPSLLARFDVALLPMEDHAYNRCKSGLKVIDYAAAGVPAVCSRTTPFAAVAGDVAAFATEPEEWLEAIERLLRYGDAERKELQCRTRSRHEVGTIADLWWSALNGH
ncbi:MAG TPA: glycosyltransferase [Thermoanaerobaculia bacterium]